MVRMEDNQISTESETGAMALEDAELLAEIGAIGRLSEEINQSLTEIQWRQQLDAPASGAEQVSQNQGQNAGGRQYPPTQTPKGRNRL